MNLKNDVCLESSRTSEQEKHKKIFSILLLILVGVAIWVKVETLNIRFERKKEHLSNLRSLLNSTEQLASALEKVTSNYELQDDSTFSLQNTESFNETIENLQEALEIYKKKTRILTNIHNLTTAP